MYFTLKDEKKEIPEFDTKYKVFQVLEEEGFIHHENAQELFYSML